MTDKMLIKNIEHIANSLSHPEPMSKEWAEEHDGEEMTALDWLEDMLDINYIVNSDGSFKSARVLVAFGGPNIWVNFDTMTVNGYWGQDAETCDFTDNLGVEDALEELWASR